MANSIWTIDGKATKGGSNEQLIWEDRRYFTLNHSGQQFHGEVVSENIESNSLTIKINQRVFEVKKNHELDDLIARMGMDKPKIQKLKELSAPMPGRIVSVEVNVGQSLDVGDEILSLEAMKMENVLKAEGVGTVKSILIKTDEVVEKGTVLIEFE
jgi:biotin carboxyl carrier protein